MTDLPVLEIAVYLLRSVEQVEHLIESNWITTLDKIFIVRYILPATVQTQSPFAGSEKSDAGTGILKN